MKIKFFNIENTFDFENTNIINLEILNVDLFKNICLDFQKIKNSIEVQNSIILSNIDKEDRLQKDDFILITDIYSNEDLQKLFSTKLIKLLEEKMLKLNTGDIILQQFNQILEIFREQVVDLNCNINYNDEIVLNDILKIINPKCVYLDYSSYLNSLVNFMALLELFGIKKLLVLIDAKRYLNEKEIIELYKQINHYNLKVLLIDSTKNDNGTENVITIDEDLFED